MSNVNDLCNRYFACVFIGAKTLEIVSISDYQVVLDVINELFFTHFLKCAYNAKYRATKCSS